MNKTAIVILMAATNVVEVLALTTEQKATLQAKVDTYLTSGTTDTHTIYRALKQTAQVGTATNVVVTARSPLELKMRQFLKAKAEAVGITAGDTIAQMDSKWDAYAQAQVAAAGTTALKLDAVYSAASDKATWFSFYTQVQLATPDDSPTVTTTNTVPVMSVAEIPFTLETKDVEDCYPKPPPPEE